MEFEIIKADIADVAADAIVLPANTKLKEGSGASAAIFKAAGRKQLTQACKKLGNCDVGSAVPTLAYGLDAEFIIHAVVPKWIDGEHDEYNLLSSAYLSSLEVADMMGCKSIAFPLLASGNNGYDPELAFQIAKENIGLYKGKELNRAILVIYDDNIAVMVRKAGYSYSLLPEDAEKRELQQEHKKKQKQLFKEGIEVAQHFLEEQLQKGIDYLKDPENRQKLFDDAVRIAGVAFAAVKTKKK